MEVVLFFSASNCWFRRITATAARAGNQIMNSWMPKKIYCQLRQGEMQAIVRDRREELLTSIEDKEGCPGVLVKRGRPSVNCVTAGGEVYYRHFRYRIKLFR